MFNHLCDFEDSVKKYLRENLQLNHKETSEYGYAGEVDRYHVVELVLDGEVISEISFSAKG